MIKLPTIALIALLFLFSCGDGEDADMSPPSIKILSPIGNDTIVMGNNIELDIEISDDKILVPKLTKAVFNFIEGLKNVDEGFKTWTIDYPNTDVFVDKEVVKGGNGYKYNIRVSIPTKNESEEYAPPGKYKLEVWNAEDRAGHTITRDSAEVSYFYIVEPPL